MTQIQQAKRDWDEKAVPHPKRHYYASTLPGGHRTEDFQQFGQAIVLINWREDCIGLVKLEKLPGTDRGAATPLIEFLKSLADKYRLFVQAHVRPYTPDPPWFERKPTLDELKAWYQKRGFKLYAGGDPDPKFPWAWYPDAPKDWLTVASELVALE